LAAENHDGAGTEAFHLVNAQLANLGTVKSRRDKRANVLGPGLNLILLLCGAGMRGRTEAKSGRVRRGEQRQRDAGQGYEQAD
jgi:hypothetical protein